MLLRILLLSVLLCPLAALCAPTVLIYGDSLSAAYGIPKDQGWADLLQKKLRAHGWPHAVVNASISGETTSGGLTRIAGTLRQHDQFGAVLELGANDGLRGLPVAEMQRNLAGIIETAQTQGAQVLLVGMRIPPNYGPRYTEAFAASYAQLARRYRLPHVPFLLDGVADQRALMQDDGLHPNAAAQPRVLDNVWKPLLQALKRRPRTS